MRVVIIGSGQAGTQCAVSLRQEGFIGEIVMFGEEPLLPYQRPPLSKAFMVGELQESSLNTVTEDQLLKQSIDLRRGSRVVSVDRIARKVTLEDSSELTFDHLVLAVGVRNRNARFSGADTQGVLSLRNMQDAQALRRQLYLAKHVVVIGGGFIGLEFGAVAQKLGKKVTIVEASNRVMARAVSPPVSKFFEQLHITHGVDLILNSGVNHITPVNALAQRDVILQDRSVLEANLIVSAIGVEPNTEIASQAGLDVNDGIEVNQDLRTADPSIWAIGDCARFPSRWSVSKQLIRLESVQNAVDQAKHVASSISHGAKPYQAIPWFWSDQFDTKLQIAGLTQAADEIVVRGSPKSGNFSVFCFNRGNFIGAESINKPTDHMAARRMLAANCPITPRQAADIGFDLKSFAQLSKNR
jgi:3-phenylpropionate/trans-cinnamate dioxygenase ferredoxin reductase component